MLDTTYQPSHKPTFVTEFAEVKISGFIQPSPYFDNNNVLNNDLFVTSEIPTQKTNDIKFKRFHMSANQSRRGSLHTLLVLYGIKSNYDDSKGKALRFLGIIRLLF